MINTFKSRKFAVALCAALSISSHSPTLCDQPTETSDELSPTHGLIKISMTQETKEEAEKIDAAPDLEKPPIISDDDFGPYSAYIRRKIRHAWSPASDKTSKRVVVLFAIQPDGVVLKTKINHSSGDPESDQCATKAILKAAPFPALPRTFPGRCVIQATFDYNVFSGGHGTFRSF